MGGRFKLASLRKYRGGLQPTYSESYVFAPNSRFRNKVDQEDRWRCSKDNVGDQFAIKHSLLGYPGKYESIRSLGRAARDDGAGTRDEADNN
jgi:hypothetical protein